MKLESMKYNSIGKISRKKIVYSEMQMTCMDTVLYNIFWIK